MHRSDVLELLTKLKAMADESRAGSPEEAANAAARMQELRFKYKITELEIESKLLGANAESNFTGMSTEDVVGDANTKRIPKWKSLLVHTIASCNFCEIVVTSNPAKAVVLGKETDIAVVIQMFVYLCDEIQRLALSLAPPIAASRRKWIHSFKTGCVVSIITRLEQQRKQDEAAHSSCTALIRKADRHVDAYLNKLFPNITIVKTSVSSSHAAGYQAGQEVGYRMPLKPGQSRLRD